MQYMIRAESFGRNRRDFTDNLLSGFINYQLKSAVYCFYSCEAGTRA